MRIIKRAFYNVSRLDCFNIIPLGDIHLGASACDEARLKRVIKRITEEPNTYWTGKGDFCDFINRSDKRFDITTLAKWLITSKNLADIAGAQSKKFLEYVAPIANKCLYLEEGNHERAIYRHYERNIYSEIVAGVKQSAGWDDKYKLALGYEGFLVLTFYGSDKKEGASVITIYSHHGYGGGRKEGSKANNLQETLWTINADIVLFGHSHNTQTQVQEVIEVRGNKVIERVRLGAYTGTFLKSFTEDSDTYSRIAGYKAIPLGGIEIVLQPRAKDYRDRIRLITNA
jgi:hypothetical protein